MAERPDILKGLQGKPPYLFHPRAFDHPGPIVSLGAHGWHYVRPFIGHKTIVGVDPCPVTKVPDGCTLVRCAVAPFNRPGAQGPLLERFDVAYLAKTIRIAELRERHGRDWAALKVNIEGSELIELIMLAEPIADQMTVAFHDRGTGDLITRTARDGVMAHLDTWYDRAQISETNDWWFFLRRERA